MCGDWGIRRGRDDHNFLEARKGRKVLKNETVMDMEGILDICSVLSVQD